MQSSNDKLAQCLEEAMELDVEKLREEMKEMEPHVFSEEFERKMEDVFAIVEKKKTRFDIKKTISVAAVLVLTVGVLGVSVGQATASNSSIDILTWAKEYFNFEKGDDVRREDGVLFEESQLGYIPDGFEKVGEIITFSSAKYEYASDNGDYIIIRATRDKTSAYQDGAGVENTIRTSEAGFEYTYILKEGIGHIYIWEGDNGIYYTISGTANETEMQRIMNEIKY